MWIGRQTRPDRLDIASDRGELFHVWRERWDDYVLLTGLKREEPRVQMAALRDCLTDDSIRVLRNLELSDSDRSDLNKSIDALEKYANGQVNEVVERKKFNERVQAEGESFDDFLTSLKELARSCNFCNTCRDSLIRDRIVMGLRSSETIKCLCVTPDLSLAATVSVCRAQEAACRDARELQLHGSGSGAASALQVRLPGPDNGARMNPGDLTRHTGRPARVIPGDVTHCSGCGWQRHPTGRPCPARGQRCRACHGLHHFAAVCRASPDQWGEPDWPHSRFRSSPPSRDRYWPSPSRTPSPSSPPRGRFRSPSPRRPYRSDSRDRRPPSPRARLSRSPDRRSRVRFQAIIASASVQGAPRIKVRVETSHAVTVEALPDTGADISVGGIQLLDEMCEYQENLLPANEHPKAANGAVIRSVGVLPVRITLGDVTVEDEIHILPSVTGLLLSWRTTRDLHITPADYPRQIRTGERASPAPSARPTGPPGPARLATLATSMPQPSEGAAPPAEPIASELQARHADVRLEEVRQAVTMDPVFQMLITTIQDGFPDTKSATPDEVKRYWPVRDRLTVDNGVVLCGCRVVIPTSLRKQTLQTLHAGHLGKERTKSRARQIVYWPGIDNDIDNFTRQCERCQSELPSQQRETLISHKLADRPFQYLDVDIASHAGGKYLVVVDGFSGWRHVGYLGRQSSTSKVITTLLEVFRHVGVAEALWSDGGPEFTSYQFREFMRKWGISHHLSSPHYPQSNGRAESGVKAAKKLLRKCWDVRRERLDDDAWTSGILQHWNTPGSHGASPAQIVYGRPIRDTLPTHPAIYENLPPPADFEDRRCDQR